MKHLSTLSPLPIFLLLISCAGNPPQQNSSDTREQDSQELPAQKAAEPAITIVPDINAEGHRGDLARAILARSSARFLEADQNQDYRISIGEAEAYLPHVSRAFLDYDKNGDGGISWQEYVRHNQWPEPVHSK